MPAERRLPPELSRSLWLGALLFAVAEALAAAFAVPAPHEAFLVLASSDWPFFAFALSGSFLVQALAVPDRRRLGAALAVGSVLSALLLAVRPDAARHPLILAVNAGACLGAGSLLVLGASAWKAGASPRDRAALGVASCLPLYVVSINSYLSLTSLLHPRTPDLFAFAFDGTLGGQASFALGRLFRRHAWLELVSMLTYQALPVGAALMVALQLRVSPERAARALWTIVLAGFSGFLLYHVVPLAGPRAAFPDFFPHSVPRLADKPLDLITLPPSFRNAMPSLHSAWALLVFWASRGLGVPARFAAGWLLVFTLVATLGSGEHYVIDLVVAAPFAVAVAAAAGSGGGDVARRRLAAASAAWVGLWLVYLRFGEALWRHAPLANRALAAASVVVPLALEAWLHRRQVRAAPGNLSGPAR